MGLPFATASIALLHLPLLAVATGPSFTDTEYWLGAAYTPAAAPGNSLWWYNYTAYEPSVRRELRMARRRLGFTALRVFLHSAVYEALGPDVLLGHIDAFLGIASQNNLSIGFVFFGDCFNHNGTLKSPCVPVKGKHNGCWEASPWDVDRTSVARFEPYVSDVVGRFAHDKRVAWWEIFNEPHFGRHARLFFNGTFSSLLRDAGYRWAKAADATQPVLSCWDDNVDTDIVDHHDYGTAFNTTWVGALTNPAKGALITEAGSRWYQPVPVPAPVPVTSMSSPALAPVLQQQEDSGSPLSVLNFLTALRRQVAAGARPFVPGAMINWEVMVGNSNTRWKHAGDALLGAPEPAIPWDAWLFPDSTPVSHTEAAAMRFYSSGIDEFIFFDDFFPVPAVVAAGDRTLTLRVGGPVWRPSTGLTTPRTSTTPPVLGDVLVEAAFWPTTNASVFDMRLRGGYRIVVNGTATLRLWRDGSASDDASTEMTPSSSSSFSAVLLGTFDLSQLENGVVVGGWNIVRCRAVGSKIEVWLNPMFPETGFRGDASDAARVPLPLRPRIAAIDLAPLPPGPFSMRAAVADVLVDYVSALPAGVF